MTDGQKQQLVQLHKQWSLRLSNVHDPKRPTRPGILNLTDSDEPNVEDFDNWPRRLMHHQIVCIHRFFSKDLDLSFWQRKVSTLALHDMGTGKTITAIAAIAAVHKLVPRLEDFRVMMVVPLSVLTIWCETLNRWTALGAKIVKVEEASQITAETLKGPVVIVTTKDVLVCAYKTFMHYRKDAEEWFTANNKRRTRPGWLSGTDPSAHHSAKERLRRSEAMKANNGVLPPHPLFAHIDACAQTKCPDIGFTEANPYPVPPHHPIFTHAFAFVGVDEIHDASNPKTQYGSVLLKVTRSAAYVMGYSGTPVRSKPSQAADLVKTLNLQGRDGQLAWLQERIRWQVRGKGKNSIRHDTINAFHKHGCDRVNDTNISLTEKKPVHVRFSPWIGRMPDGTIHEAHITRHNAYLNRAQQKAIDAANGGARDEEYRASLMSCFNSSAQFCMSGVLGMHTASGFGKNKQLYDEALKQPSEQMRLIWRLIRDRQTQGHGRIVIYSESVVMLELLANQLTVWGECGKLALFTGKCTLAQRDAKVAEFLDPATPRGVLFISQAGAVGVTLCPGCDTLFVVGDIPWTYAELMQAVKRVHRITQDKPVEIVYFEPIRSIIKVKYEAHREEEEKLYPAVLDNDFSNFDEGPVDEWRLRNSATLDMATVNEWDGCYGNTTTERDRLAQWQADYLLAEGQGNPLPEKPLELVIEDPVLADDYDIQKLWPCSFPVKDFVEPPCEAYPSPLKLNPKTVVVQDKNKTQAKRKVKIEDDSEYDSDDLLENEAVAIQKAHVAKKPRRIPVPMTKEEQSDLDKQRIEAMRKLLWADDDADSSDEE